MTEQSGPYLQLFTSALDPHGMLLATITSLVPPPAWRREDYHMKAQGAKGDTDDEQDQSCSFVRTYHDELHSTANTKKTHELSHSLVPKF